MSLSKVNVGTAQVLQHTNKDSNAVFDPGSQICAQDRSLKRILPECRCALRFSSETRLNDRMKDDRVLAENMFEGDAD